MASVLNVFGDSNSCGDGVTPVDRPWPALLPDAEVHNFSRSGLQCIDIGVHLYAAPPLPSAIMIGTNDQITTGYGSDPAKRAHWKNMLTAALAWPVLADKTAAADAQVQGEWASIPNFGRGGLSSSTPGSSITFTIEGDVAYFWTVVDEGSRGTWRIRQGQSIKMVGATAPAACIRSTNNFGYRIAHGMHLERIAGLGAGWHELVFEAMDGVCFCMAATGLVGHFNPVYAGNVPGMNAHGFAMFGVDEANLAAFNADHASAVGTLVGDGLPVMPVDVHALGFAFQADGVHLTPGDHQLMAQAFSSAVSRQG